MPKPERRPAPRFEPSPEPTRHQEPAPEPAPEPKPVQEYTEVATVSVPVSAANLDPRDFTAESDDPAVGWEVVRAEYVPNVEEKVVQRKALSLALLCDQSGSIEKTDPSNSRVPAAQRLVDLLPGDARTAVLHFPYVEYGAIIAPVTVDAGFSDTPSPAREAIGRLAGKQSGPTPLLSALAQTINLLRKEDPERERVVICFSDGLPEGDDPVLTPGAIASRARAANVRLFFVALGDKDWTLIRDMASATGGNVISVGNASQLDEAFGSIARKVSKVDRSFYRLTLRARRSGAPFRSGEMLRGSVLAAGQRQAFVVQAGK